MKAKAKVHQVNLATWSARIKEQADSGLSVKEWCAKNNLSFHAHNYWKHALKEAYIDSIMPEIVPIATSPVCTNAPAYSDPTSDQCSLDSHILCNSRQASTSLRVSLNDIQIDIGSSVSDEMVTSIIKAVRHA